MDGVAVSPMIVRCQGHHTDGAPYPVVRRPMTEECAMTTVVLDHEQPHKEACCRQSDDQAEPITQIETCPHQDPEQDERNRSDQDLEDAADVIWLPITMQNWRPVAWIRNTVGRLCLLQK